LIQHYVTVWLRTVYSPISVESQSLCHPNPCHGGGTCEEHDGVFTCYCPEGFTGSQCQHDVTKTNISVASFVGDSLVGVITPGITFEISWSWSQSFWTIFSLTNNFSVFAGKLGRFIVMNIILILYSSLIPEIKKDENWVVCKIDYWCVLWSLVRKSCVRI